MHGLLIPDDACETRVGVPVRVAAAVCVESEQASFLVQKCAPMYPTCVYLAIVPFFC